MAHLRVTEHPVSCNNSTASRTSPCYRTSCFLQQQHGESPSVAVITKMGLWNDWTSIFLDSFDNQTDHLLILWLALIAGLYGRTWPARIKPELDREKSNGVIAIISAITP